MGIKIEHLYIHDSNLKARGANPTVMNGLFHYEYKQGFATLVQDMPDGGIMFKALGPASLSSQANILSHLVLSKNKLDQVPTQAIKSLHNLYHLNLNHGRLSNFHRTDLCVPLCLS